MTNPVLPADFNLGSYLGESIGQGLQGGLSKSIGEAYESKFLQNAFNDLDPNASPQEKLQKFMSLPISNQSKQLGLKYLQKAQANQPSLESVQKGIQGRSKQVEGLDSLVKSADFGTLQALEQEALKRGGDAKAIDSVLSDWQKNKNWKPGTPLTSEAPPEEKRKTFFGKNNTNKLEKAWRTSKLGKLFGFADPERLEQLAKEDPDSYNDWISSNLGPIAIDFPLYATALRLGGPIGGLAAVEGLVEGVDQTRNLAAKNAKGEQPTGEDYQKAATKTVQSILKGAVWGAFARAAPLEKLLKATPGGRKLLENSFAQGAAQVAGSGLIAPEAATLASEGRLQDSGERTRNILLALGMKGASAAMQGVGRPGGQAPPQEPGQITHQPALLTHQPQQPTQPAPTPPNPLEAMVQGAKSGEQAMQSLRTAQKINPLGPQSFQKAEGANVPPGSEAVGDVSRTVAPQPQEQGPLRTPGSQPARAPNKVTTTVPTGNNAQLQDASTVSGLAGRITPPAPTGQPAPRPQPTQELGPLEREQRMGQMRGEKPFLGKENKPTGREKTETLQKKGEQEKVIEFHRRQLKDLIRQLNLRQAAARTAKGAEKESLDKEIATYKSEIDQVKKSLRQANKELEGKTALTDQNIERAIANRRSRLLEEATTPPKPSEKETGKRQLKKLANEQKAKEAKALARKKHNLPEEYTDSFLRVKQRYVDEFSKLRDHATREMKDNAENSQEHKVAKRIHDEADQIVKEAEADIVKHKHKKGAEHVEKQALEKKALKQRESASKKIAKVTPERIASFTKDVKQYLETKSKPALEKVAKAMEMEPEQVEKVEKETADLGRDFASRSFRILKIKPKVRTEESKGPEQPKGTEDFQRKKGESSEDFKERVKAKTKQEGSKEKPKEEPKQETTNAQQKTSRFQRLKQEAKDLFQNIKKGEFKKIWANPIGRAFIIQSVAAGADSAMKALGITKTPFNQFATLFIGGTGRLYRIPATVLINLIKSGITGLHSMRKVSSYNEALKNKDLAKVRELEEKLTPKQKKKALQKRTQ